MILARQVIFNADGRMGKVKQNSWHRIDNDPWPGRIETRCNTHGAMLRLDGPLEPAILNTRLGIEFAEVFNLGQVRDLKGKVCKRCDVWEAGR